MTRAATAGLPAGREAFDPGPEFLRALRVIVVAGIPVGVLVGGFGGRLAMLLLRATSDDSVRGVTSDDGFTIGRLTIAGTYSLLLIGAAVGILGAAVYRLVAPRLIGPTWFRRLTVALAAGAVVGAMLVHADGVDFVVLTPTWLAIGSFVALPAAFGWCIAAAVDRVGAAPLPGSVARRWGVPLGLIAAFPAAAIPTLAMVAFGVAVAVSIGQAEAVTRFRVHAVTTFFVRLAWLGVALGGAGALAADIDAIY